MRLKRLGTLSALLLPLVAYGASLISHGARLYVTQPTTPDWLLASGHYVNAKQSLQIIAPRAGLSTANIYYLAHPGMEYRLPVAVLGGARPAHYALTTAPSGMTINAATGVMSWPNPTTSGSPHSVTAEVCDQQHTRPSSSCTTVSWTITVQTSGFVFIATGGNDGAAGTIGAPKQTIAAIEAASTTDIVVLRNGVSLTWDSDLCDDARRIMAYPGETATLSFATEQCAGLGDIATNRAFVGLTLVPKSSTSGGTAIMDWPSGPTDILVYANTITDPGGSCAGGSNPALFFSGANAPSWTQYIAFVGNDIQGTGCSSVFLGYSTRYLVAEDNTLSNSALHGWSAKTRNQYWTIAENTGLNGNTAELFNASDYDVTDSIEVCWNNFASTSYGMLFEQGNGDTETGATNIWSYRNTWQITHHQVQWDPVGLTVQNDVTEYVTSGADPHGWLWNDTADSGSYSGEECVGRGVNIVNSAGVLQGSYATACLGTRGHVAQ